MKRYTVVGIALAMIVLLIIAGVAFVAYSMGRNQVASNQTPYGYGPGAGRGMGMGRGMMGGSNTPGGGLAPVNPTAPAAQPAAPSSGAAPTNAPTNMSTQKAGNWNVTLALTPYPPVSFQPTTFDITITDEKGSAVSDAKVSLDLTMPSMWMPSNKPTAQSLGEGKYQATGRFTMRGGWQIAVIVERGAEKQTAYFQLGL